MNFYDWMSHKGLSKSSARSYDGALRGSLSEWAMDCGLISGPLIALTSSSAFGALTTSIQELPVFKERNARGHHMYSATLSQFAAYLTSNGSDDVQADLEQIISDPTTTTTEKTALIKSRIGQGTFREKVLLHWTGDLAYVYAALAAGLATMGTMIAVAIKGGAWFHGRNDSGAKAG